MNFRSPKTNSCQECGKNAIPHRTTYVMVTIDSVLKRILPFDGVTSLLAKKLQPFEHAVSEHLFHVCLRLGWAKKQTEIDDNVSLLSQMLWREANSRGINVWEFRLFGLPRNIFLAELPNGKRITYEGTPVPPCAAHQEWWLDDKSVLKKQFRHSELPVAKGGTAITKNGVINLFRSLKAPVIIKPHSGSGSRHTTLHIMNEEELLRAFAIAKQVSPAAIIEEELVGPVYRATVVDGKLVAALRRDQPHVIGDGEKTIRELIDDANEHPARSGPYFSKITINTEAVKELSWQGFTLEDVLLEGKRVTFHQKVNWSVGGTTADVSDEVHQDNRELFERVAEVLKAPLVGIDFIIEDIRRSWKEQERCGIIECNSMPFFDNHHLPFEGKPRNVAGAIWDMMESHG